MKIYNSRLWVSLFFLAVIILICVTFTSRKYWWCYFDIFFIFMGAFCQLMALTLGVRIPQVGAKLSVIAFICIVAGIVSLIGESIALYFI